MKPRRIPKIGDHRRALFEAKVAAGAEDACWSWTACTDRYGYGTFGWNIRGRPVTFLAHRIAYFIATGEQPGALFVCHSCDNPSCCNPAHLFLGTHLDNVADRDKKGRGGGNKRRGANNGRYTMPERTCRGEAWTAAHPPEERARAAASIRKFYEERPGARAGEKNPRSKLVAADVKEIRKVYRPGRTPTNGYRLAERYGVSKTVIMDIVNGKRWAHVT